MKNKLYGYADKYGINSIIIRNFTKSLLAFLLAVAIPISIAHIIFINSIKKEAVTNGQIESQKIMITAENLFRDMEYLAVNVFSNEDIRIFFVNRDEECGENVKNSLLTYSNVNLDFKGVYIYKPNIKEIYNFEGILNEQRKKEINWIDKLDTMKGDYQIEFQRSNNNTIISYVFFKRDPLTGGIVIIEVDSVSITKALKDIANVDSVFYIAKNKDIIYRSTSDDSEGKIIFDKSENVVDDTFYTTKSSDYYKELEYIVAIDMHDYKMQMRNAYMFMAIILLSIIVFIIIMAYVISKDNVGYIIWLTELLDKNKKPVGLKDNEIKYITDKVISIVDDNKNLRKEIENRIDEYNKISIRALQAQISPHFFNNSLNAVNYRLKKEFGYGSQTSDMLCKLSKIIGYNYVADKVFVNVKEEFDFIRDYIEFMKVRYGDFESVLYLQEGLEEEKIVKMCLQPFVENSVFHGFSKEKNILKISCTKEENNFVISIFDNGIGIEKESADKILRESENESFTEENIGMKNVFRRLKLIYGEKLDIKIESKRNEFTKIILKIQKS